VSSGLCNNHTFMGVLFLSKYGQQLGPFTDEQIRSLVSQGMATTSDSVWTEGGDCWIPLGTILELCSPPSGLPEDEPNAEAQISLGNKFYQGDGVVQNYSLAMKWYRRAAEQGNVKAQCLVGSLYSNGQGVVRDFEQAFSWYLKAAEQRDDVAQYTIGLMYFWGRGVIKDYTQALRWFHKAAERGCAGSLYFIGAMYEYGEGVPQSAITAIEWYKKAASLGHPDAQADVDRLGSPPSTASITTASAESSSCGLWQDLTKYAGEAYNHGDVAAGYKLIIEIVGVASLLVLAAQLEIVFTGGRSSFLFNKAISDFFRIYGRLNTDERRQVRAWVGVARTGFGLLK
jgi:TPR repeat protein